MVVSIKYGGHTNKKLMTEENIALPSSVILDCKQCFELRRYSVVGELMISSLQVLSGYLFLFIPSAAVIFYTSLPAAVKWQRLRQRIQNEL